ncbi:MAG TPA: hypothetical protein VKM55_08790 [Candidatus Lokiarchaeia archaeon]|nr:hypothetical protein [Candidatus Lokiarchaeia archaeon]
MIDADQVIMEWQVLAYVIPVILGWELGVYFFYQFWKNRKAKLRMNRILLSFGCFTILMVTGALYVMINRLFFNGTDISLLKIGLFHVFLAPVMFMVFIDINESRTLMNVRLARIVTIASLLPIILLVTIGPQSIFFRFSIIITVLNAYFVIAYQIKMIRISMGKIHRRMIQLFIGEIFALSSLLFAANLVFLVIPGVQVISFFIGVILLITGFITMFWGTNDLPLFYEFDWKDNLHKLFIIDQKHGQFLFTRDFTHRLDLENNSASEEREQMRDDLFTGAIDGIETMISTITSSPNQRLSEIDQGDSMILLEYGNKFSSPIIYALIVKKNLSSLRHLLKRLQGQFEAFFTDILQDLDQLNQQGPESQFFGSFDIILKNLMNA